MAWRRTNGAHRPMVGVSPSALDSGRMVRRWPLHPFNCLTSSVRMVPARCEPTWAPSMAQFSGSRSGCDTDYGPAKAPTLARVSTPEFILALREKVGHAPLWLSGVSAVIARQHHDEPPKVLLIRRADTGRWSNVAGIIEPGEEPADAAEREALEEAGVTIIAEKLAWVRVLPLMTWPNGDQAQSLDLVFLCRHVSGEPSPVDDENTDAAWFRLDDLPPLPPMHLERIRVALGDDPRARFERSGPQPDRGDLPAVSQSG